MCMLKEVIKRNGKHVTFREPNIRRAILNANRDVSVLERASDEDIDAIVKYIRGIKQTCVHIEVIQNIIEDKLMEQGHFELAKQYIIYRYVHNVGRELTKTEKSVVKLIRGDNEEVQNENSNKNATVNSTQRDLMAGEVSKDIANKFILPDDIRKANEDCVLHWHDADYTVQPMMNCFSRDTVFFTADDGYVTFEQFEDGDEVEVYTHTGNIRKATVHNYGKQKLNKVTFSRGSKTEKTVKVTPNHTWILKGGIRTTNLRVGDRLLVAPKISSFNLNTATKEEKFWFCIGFILGDGSDKHNNGVHYGVTARLCGKKADLLPVFEECGYTVNYFNCSDGDPTVYLADKTISKQSILTNKEYLDLDRNLKIALFNGLLCADGERQPNGSIRGISTSDNRVFTLIVNLAQMSGYYLGVIRTDRNSTNFKEDRVLHHIGLTEKQVSNFPWIAEKIEPLDEEEDVWCLDVEEDHSFILTNGMITGNCCLLDIKNCLDNGTVMNGLLIESPHSFRVACNVMTQLIANIASNQYGGQSVAIKHLGKYVAISRERINIKLRKKWEDAGIPFTEEQLNSVVESMLKDEITDGVQTIQYQINTLFTSNGQSPFLTLFLHIDEENDYTEEIAMIVEEIIKQRIQGVKNKDGKYITPAFPKLVYVLDENNSLNGGKYDYITELCIKCNIKRMYPDYVSAKIMRQNYDGEVFSPMGCRSFLSPWKKTPEYVHKNNEPESEIGKYKWEGRFNQGVVSINLPQIAIEADRDMDKFWLMLNERLSLCYKALLLRHTLLEGTLSDSSPLHWQDGAIARLKQGEKIDELLHNGYSTISLGYIGIYETVQCLIGKSHTTPEGEQLALKIMNKLRNACDQWKIETGLGFGLYGTPRHTWAA